MLRFVNEYSLDAYVFANTKYDTDHLDLLKKQKKRTISEIEVYLSIAEGSRTRYCNPVYNIEKLLKEGSPATSTYEATILVEDSQVC